LGRRPSSPSLEQADLGRHHAWLHLHLLLPRSADEESTVTGSEEEGQWHGGAAVEREKGDAGSVERERGKGCSEKWI
jgi:hypothetical protein